MSEKKNSSTKPATDINEYSLDPTAVIHKPEPQIQPNQGEGTQQSTETTSSVNEGKE